MRALLIFALLAGAPDDADPAADSPPAGDVIKPPARSDRLAAALAPRPGGLTADEVARRAVTSSPAVEQRRADLESTAASRENTISQFIPNVTATASYTRLSPAEIDFGGGGASVGALNEGPLGVGPCPGGGGNCVVDSGGVPVMAVGVDPINVPVNNYSLQAMLTVPFLDYALKLLPARRGSDANTTAALYQRDAEKVRVELDARVAYYDWIRSRAQVAVSEQALERTRARLEDARIGAQAGTLTRVDVMRLDGLVASAEANLQRARSFEALAAQNLAITMGDTHYQYEVGDNVLEPPRELEGRPDRATLTEEARVERLEIKALRATDESLVEARKATRANFWPRIDGHAEVTYANPNQRFFPLTNEWNASWSAGVTATWQLSTFLAARSQSKEVDSSRRVTRANLTAMERAVELEVNAAWEERERARATVELTRRSLDAAEAAYDQQVSLYRGGEATTTDVLGSETERINATLQDVNARIDLHVAHAKLERASGRMVPLGTGDLQDQKHVPRRLREESSP